MRKEARRKHEDDVAFSSVTLHQTVTHLPDLVLRPLPPSFPFPVTFQSGSAMRGKGSKSLARRGSPVMGLRGRLSGWRGGRRRRGLSGGWRNNHSLCHFSRSRRRLSALSSVHDAGPPCKRPREAPFPALPFPPSVPPPPAPSSPNYLINACILGLRRANGHPERGLLYVLALRLQVRVDGLGQLLRRRGGKGKGEGREKGSRQG